MPRNETKAKETLGWLEKACQDIDSAEILFRANKPTQWHQVLFFCQQAAEKSMKAFLVWHNTEFHRTHDLVELGIQCIAIDPSLEGDSDKVAYLSDYAWEFRYPGEDPEPSKEEAKAGIAHAKKFQSEILGRLPKEVRPKNG